MTVTNSLGMNPGTAGYAIKSNGAGSVATSVDPTTLGTLIPLVTRNASVSATLEFNTYIDGTYEVYKLEYSGLYQSIDAALGIQVSVNGGSTWLGATSNYGWSRNGFNDSSTLNRGGDNTDTSLEINDYPSTTLATSSGEVWLLDPNAGTFNVLATALSVDTTHTYAATVVAGSAVDAFRIRPTVGGGTMTAGKFILYGVL